MGLPHNPKTWPKFILNQYNSLEGFLKPPMPNGRFKQAWRNIRFQLFGRAIGITKYHILEQMDLLGFNLLNLKLSNTALQDAIALAKKWAKARLRKKLKHSTLLTWETAIHNFHTEKHTPLSYYLPHNKPLSGHHHTHNNSQTNANNHTQTHRNPTTSHHTAWVKPKLTTRQPTQTKIQSTPTANRFSPFTNSHQTNNQNNPPTKTQTASSSNSYHNNSQRGTNPQRSGTNITLSGTNIQSQNQTKHKKHNTKNSKTNKQNQTNSQQGTNPQSQQPKGSTNSTSNIHNKANTHKVTNLQPQKPQSDTNSNTQNATQPLNKKKETQTTTLKQGTNQKPQANIQKSSQGPHTHTKSKQQTNTKNNSNQQTNMQSTKTNNTHNLQTTKTTHSQKGASDKVVRNPPQSLDFSLQIQGTSNQTSGEFTQRYPDHLLYEAKLDPLDVQSRARSKEQRDLSNFAKLPDNLTLNYTGNSYDSIERGYQHKKLKCLGHPAANQILSMTGGGGAIKSFVTRLKLKKHPLMGEWDKIKANVMRELVELRAREDQSYCTALLNTYPQKITHNLADDFWGSIPNTGSNQKPKDAFSIILMEVRYQLALRNGLAQTNTSFDFSDEQEWPTPETPSHPRSPEPNNSQDLSKNKGRGKKSKPTVRNNQINNSDSHSQGPLPPTHSQPHQNSESNTPKTTTDVVGPNKHYHTGITKTKWHLPQISEQIAVIGDSNVNRFTHRPENMQRVVIHSFPGAKLTHAKQLFPPGKNQKTPKQVIVSLGINNRDCNEITLTDQIARLMNSASRYFPDSNIFIPQINYSEKLPIGARRSLDILNQKIKHYCNLPKYASQFKCIPTLPKTEGFVTDKQDPNHIHWAQPTANKILKHWSHYLN